MAITVIPYTTRCEGCNRHLQYEFEDIVVDKSSHYDKYGDLTVEEVYRYIICPVCGRKVYVSVKND